MLRFKDGLKSSPPALPVFWVSENGHKIYWDTVREYWLSFMQKINDFTDGNGLGRVPESSVENQICRQFPAWACAGDGTPDEFPAVMGKHTHAKCGGCGR